MRGQRQGYALLSVLVLMMLLAGLCSLALSSTLRQLRTNQNRAHTLQDRADRLQLFRAEHLP